MNKNLKAPKLRFRPGEFFKDSKGNIWCIIYIYRLLDSPNIWIYCLEERKNLKNPSTYQSMMCETISQSKVPSSLIVKEPFKDSLDAMSHFSYLYAHGDHIHTPAQKLYNNYTPLSSGEIS